MGAQRLRLRYGGLGGAWRRWLVLSVLAVLAVLASGAPGSRASAGGSTQPETAPGPVVSLSSCFAQSGHTDGVDATQTPTGWIPLVGTTQTTKPWNVSTFSAQCRAAFAIAYLPIAQSSVTPTAQQTAAFGSPMDRVYAAEAATLTGGFPASMSLVATSPGSGSDGPSGVNSQFSFPNQSTLANSWDQNQAYSEGVAYGTVAHNTNATGVNSPEMSIVRNWHYGREPEGLSEDPYLASRLAIHEMRGMQSQHVTTEVKHCCAYGQQQDRGGDGIAIFGPLSGSPSTVIGTQDNYGTHYNVVAPQRVLQEIYYPGFEAAVRPEDQGGGGATAAMCAYATVNAPLTASPGGASDLVPAAFRNDPGKNPWLDEGHQSCENHYQLQDVLKNQFGFLGSVVNDCCTVPNSNLLAWLSGDDSASLTSDSQPRDQNNNPLQIAEPLSYSGVGNDPATERRLQQPISSNPLTVTTAMSQALIPLAKVTDALSRKLVPGWLVGVDTNPRTKNGYDLAQITATARQTLDDASVLLKNAHHNLPLDPSRDQTLAVIGEQASGTTETACAAAPADLTNCDIQWVNTGSGSAWPKPADDPVTPLAGLKAAAAAAGGHVQVAYAQGTQGLAKQPLLQEQVDASGQPAAGNELSTDSVGRHPGVQATYYNDTAFGADTPADDHPVLATRTEKAIVLDNVNGPQDQVIGNGPGQFVSPTRPDNQWSAKWKGYFTAQHTGSYHFSMFGSGTGKLYLGAAGSDLGRVTRTTPIAKWTRDDFDYTDHGYVNLVAGRSYPIEVDYSPNVGAATSSAVTLTGNNVPAGEPGGADGTLSATYNTLFQGGIGTGIAVGVSEPTTLLADAVAAARQANQAVVFVGEQAGEGVDRASLELPGNQDQLISAVADANPNTTVVMIGPGAYAMPWLSKVKSVLFMGYPGGVFGSSAADLLFGAANPSGKLAVTFPAGETQENGTNDKSVYPGLPAQDHPVTNGSDDPHNQSDDVHQIANVFYKDGLDVGYRYYVSTHLDPLFRFGYGLSYTSFAERVVGVHQDGNGDVILDVKVTNTGPRDGKQVVEGYVGDPQGTGEPALQLKAFEKVSVAAGQSTIAHLGFAPRAFAYWSDRGTARFPNGQWKVDPGTYSLEHRHRCGSTGHRRSRPSPCAAHDAGPDLVRQRSGRAGDRADAFSPAPCHRRDAAGSHRRRWASRPLDPVSAGRQSLADLRRPDPVAPRAQTPHAVVSGHRRVPELRTGRHGQVVAVGGPPEAGVIRGQPARPRPARHPREAGRPGSARLENSYSRLEIPSLGDARGEARGALVRRAGADRVAGHLQKMGPHGRQAVMVAQRLVERL